MSEVKIDLLALADAASLRAERDRLREALEQIERWDGFPPGTDGKSYGYSFGSNGERDFMRGIARAALRGAR